MERKEDIITPQPPKTIFISINVGILGNLNYKGVNANGQLGSNFNASIAGANKEDTVVWECKKDYFSIDFGSRSPFKNLSYMGAKKHPIRATVKALTAQEEGPYKYSVTVFNSKGVKKYSDDPVLIIPPVRP